MSLYILDTDHLSLLRKGHPVVVSYFAAMPQPLIAVSIITVDEQLTGWYSRLRQARNAIDLAQAYDGLLDVVNGLLGINIVPLTVAAAQRYLVLRKQLRRLGKMDLAIAAIVLEMNGTLLTRNWSDFQQVPGLTLEDWSKP